MTERYLIVGLGNPGKEYDNTRHNVGFRCVDALAQAHHIAFEPKKRSHAKIADGTIAGRRVLLAKPQTYMNLSGSAAQGLMAFYKIPPSRLLVIFDDLDLPFGTLRIRHKGGAGGHRGLTDIIQRLGTQDFPRIRFGIGRPPNRMDPAAYVLRPFDGEETATLQLAIARVNEAVETWLVSGLDAAMNHFNGSVNEPDQNDTPAKPHASPTPSTGPSLQ
ncbi:MAG TPA: aminoacyl-tRNA hydrolase [Aggregatilinea sp.]|uniref:aminoacyl-tRNA hydrolase n=1 Tax=Aggregatilinea sp. TaxID=2806333 RepID=UPI002B5A9CED|nr:aminoacyl-tRNA hydrolase [Aggregatilinea sp.]HML20065.1 aminoacyl-tRNA hydrolase [Aggregatilinea sp.]